MKGYGTYINNAGKRRYTSPEASENLIKYVTRNNGKSADDLLAWGGLGITEFLGIETIIDQFHHVQKMHTRKGRFGRYADHEFFSFTAEAEKIINENELDIDKIARQMAYDIYDNDKCQVVYGVHRPDESNKHLHIHFVINAVNYTNGNKRRENTTETKERKARFQQMVNDEFKRVR